VVGGSEVGTIWWMEPNGATPVEFISHVAVSTPGITALSYLVVGDVNMDGFEDIVHVGGGTILFAWHESSGTDPPTFTTHALSAPGVPAPRWLIIAGRWPFPSELKHVTARLGPAAAAAGLHSVLAVRCTCARGRRGPGWVS
jgi:hypothetical protein